MAGRPANDLLELKVLDPAMGSAAFLVSACRFLCERVVAAWERDGYPDTVQAALGLTLTGTTPRSRLVAASRRAVCAASTATPPSNSASCPCWLVTLSKDQPFSFLDHALRMETLWLA